MKKWIKCIVAEVIKINSPSYFCIVLQEATFGTYFPSWEAIENHREVVKFMCGLMLDPRPLVDHVYTTLITFLLRYCFSLKLSESPNHWTSFKTGL